MGVRIPADVRGVPQPDRAMVEGVALVGVEWTQVRDLGASMPGCGRSYFVLERPSSPFRVGPAPSSPTPKAASIRDRCSSQCCLDLSDAPFSILTSVAKAAANDVWAVGWSSSTTGGFTLIEHWNGSAWSIVPSPNGPGINNLEGVAVASAGDVWAVGERNDTSQSAQPLTEHWNGSAWSIVASASNPGGGILYGVTANSSFTWAVGANTYGAAFQTLTERWDGSAWSILSSPSPQEVHNAALNSVAAVTPDNIWAVGINS